MPCLVLPAAFFVFFQLKYIIDSSQNNKEVCKQSEIVCRESNFTLAFMEVEPLWV